MMHPRRDILAALGTVTLAGCWDSEASNPDDPTTLERIVEGYAIWMQYNYKANTRLAPLGTGILLLLMYGVVFLGVGVHDATTETAGPITAVGILVVGILLTWRSGIGQQIQRYWQYRTYDPTED